MKLNKIHLQNYKSATNLTIELSEDLIVFAGINGSGKSTILDSLAVSLSWLVNRIQRQNSNGRPIADSSIRNQCSYSTISLHVSHQSKKFAWKIFKAAPGKESKQKSSLTKVTDLAEIIKRKFDSDLTLPVIAYYPVNRVVGDIKPEVSSKDSANVLDVYENSLGGKANFEAFFDWFRIQEDILNEEALSNSTWLKKNRLWIDKRINKILDSFRRVFLEKNNINSEKVGFEHLRKRFLSRNQFIESPRFFFDELSAFLYSVISRSNQLANQEKVLFEIEYMFHAMGSLINEFGNRNNFDVERFDMSIRRVSRGMELSRFSENLDPDIYGFIWECFCFATLLNLWWLKPSNFERLDYEIQEIFLNNDPTKKWIHLTNILTKITKNIIYKELHSGYKASNIEFELENVRSAIESFLPEYSHLRVQRYPQPQMLISKYGKEFNLNQLSDGEKSIIALVGDIARRLALANPGLKNPLEGQGIILIDEIDLHLHPSWQRMIISRLLSVFPNCQFIITTHSPQVLGEVNPECIRLLVNDERGFIECTKPDKSFGLDSSEILENLMDTSRRNIKVTDKLDLIYQKIEDNEFVEAKVLIERLREELNGDIPDLVRASSLLTMLSDDGENI